MHGQSSKDACDTANMCWLAQQTDKGAQVLIIASGNLCCAATSDACEHFSCCSALLLCVYYNLVVIGLLYKAAYTYKSC